MSLENTTTVETNEKALSATEIIVREVGEALAKIPDARLAEKSAYLFETLNKKYGSVLTRSILNNIPAEFLAPPTPTMVVTAPTRETPENNKEKNESLLDIELARLTSKIPAGLSREEKEKAFKKIMWEEYGISPNTVKNTDWKISPETKRKAMKIGTYALPFVAVLSFIVARPDFKSSEQKKEIKKETEKPKVKEVPVVERPEPAPEKIVNFNKETYDQLPAYGKEVYEYFSNPDNITPGRSYSFLDKSSATVYVFDENNKLVSSDDAGFGETHGDEKNTYVDSTNTGTTTTPAGAYLMSLAALDEAKDLYGKDLYTLIGKSIKGENSYVNLHQIYPKPKEFKERSKLMHTPSPLDNNFSKGCINMWAQFMDKNFLGRFKGDYGELFFVLPDKASTDKFDIKKLVHDIAPMIIEMAGVAEPTLTTGLKRVGVEATALSEKISELEKTQMMLVSEYTKHKDKTNRKKIEKIKKEIGETKDHLGNVRGQIRTYERALDSLQKKRDSAKRVLETRAV